MKKYNTARFGEIEIDEKEILHFEKGIPAFEKEQEFVLMSSGLDTPYVFMQSLRTPELAFLMAKPYGFFPDYEFILDDDTEAELGLTAPDELEVFVILAMPAGGTVHDITANLVAPIVINTTSHQAKQVVLDKSQYNTQHRLFSQAKEED